MRRLLALLPCAWFTGCVALDRRTAYDCPCEAVGEAGVAAGYVEAGRRHGDGNGAIWSFLSTTYDRDGDGAVTAAEYLRKAEAFARFDGNQDGRLTSGDFDGPTSMEAYLAEFVWRRLVAVGVPDAGVTDTSPLGAEALEKAFVSVDVNGNSRVGERELLSALRAGDGVKHPSVPRFPQGVSPFPVVLASLDTDRSGDLSKEELEAWRAKESAQAAAAKATEVAKAAAADGKAAPVRKMPSRRGLPVGETAFDFTLRTADGASEIALASFRGVKPVVLIFGSYTCPPFRHVAARLREVADAHAADAQFLFVYIREAHAVDGRTPMPSPTQPIVEEPLTEEERRLIASSCLFELGFDRFPTLVDGIGDEVARAYAAPPARIYVVGKDGKIVYQSAPGPFGLDADAVEAAVRGEAAKSGR